MLLSKKKLNRIKKSKNQSQKKYNKKRKNKRKPRNRSFSKRKKYLNLKNKSLKFRKKKYKQKGGDSTYFYLAFMSKPIGQNPGKIKIFKITLNDKLLITDFLTGENNWSISGGAFINLVNTIINVSGKDTLNNQKITLELIKSFDYNDLSITKHIHEYNVKIIKSLLSEPKTPDNIENLKEELKIKMDAVIDELKQKRQEQLRRQTAEEAAAAAAEAQKRTLTPNLDLDTATKTEEDIPSSTESSLSTGIAPFDDLESNKSQTTDNLEAEAKAEAEDKLKGQSIQIGDDGIAFKSGDDGRNDQDDYRGDEQMKKYAQKVQDDTNELMTRDRKATVTTKGNTTTIVREDLKTKGSNFNEIPQSLGAPDPIKTSNEPVYPHNLLLQITTRDGNEGWTNVDVIDSGDGPLTLDAFNNLLLKKYNYKKEKIIPKNKKTKKQKEQTEQTLENLEKSVKDEANKQAAIVYLQKNILDKTWKDIDPIQIHHSELRRLLSPELRSDNEILKMIFAHCKNNLVNAKNKVGIHIYGPEKRINLLTEYFNANKDFIDTLTLSKNEKESHLRYFKKPTYKEAEAMSKSKTKSKSKGSPEAQSEDSSEGMSKDGESKFDKPIATITLTKDIQANTDKLDIPIDNITLGDTLKIGDEERIVVAFGSVILDRPLTKEYKANTKIEIKKTDWENRPEGTTLTKDVWLIAINNSDKFKKIFYDNSKKKEEKEKKKEEKEQKKEEEEQKKALKKANKHERPPILKKVEKLTFNPNSRIITLKGGKNKFNDVTNDVVKLIEHIKSNITTLKTFKKYFKLSEKPNSNHKKQQFMHNILNKVTEYYKNIISKIPSNYKDSFTKPLTQQKLGYLDSLINDITQSSQEQLNAYTLDGDDITSNILSLGEFANTLKDHSLFNNKNNVEIKGSKWLTNIRNNFTFINSEIMKKIENDIYGGPQTEGNYIRYGYDIVNYSFTGYELKYTNKVIINKVEAEGDDKLMYSFNFLYHIRSIIKDIIDGNILYGLGDEDDNTKKTNQNKVYKDILKEFGTKHDSHIINLIDTDDTYFIKDDNNKFNVIFENLNKTIVDLVGTVNSNDFKSLLKGMLCAFYRASIPKMIDDVLTNLQKMTKNNEILVSWINRFKGIFDNYKKFIDENKDVQEINEMVGNQGLSNLQKVVKFNGKIKKNNNIKYHYDKLKEWTDQLNTLIIHKYFEKEKVVIKCINSEEKEAEENCKYPFGGQGNSKIWLTKLQNKMNIIHKAFNRTDAGEMYFNNKKKQDEVTATMKQEQKKSTVALPVLVATTSPSSDDGGESKETRALPVLVAKKPTTPPSSDDEGEE